MRRCFLMPLLLNSHVSCLKSSAGTTPFIPPTRHTQEHRCTAGNCEAALPMFLLR